MLQLPWSDGAGHHGIVIIVRGKLLPSMTPLPLNTGHEGVGGPCSALVHERIESGVGARAASRALECSQTSKDMKCGLQRRVAGRVLSWGDKCQHPVQWESPIVHGSSEALSIATAWFGQPRRNGLEIHTGFAEHAQR